MFRAYVACGAARRRGGPTPEGDPKGVNATRARGNEVSATRVIRHANRVRRRKLQTPTRPYEAAPPTPHLCTKYSCLGWVDDVDRRRRGARVSSLLPLIGGVRPGAESGTCYAAMPLSRTEYK